MSLLFSMRGRDDDPLTGYWGNVVVAMTMDGTDGATDFVDLKGNPFTRYGHVYKTTAQKKFGTASAYFDGTGDCFSFTDSALFDIPGDFSTDLWVRFGDVTISHDEHTLFQLQGTQWSVCLRATVDGTDANKIAFYDGSAYRIQSGYVAINTWYHVLLQRKSGVVELFVDGTRRGTHSYATALTPTALNVGSTNGGAGSRFMLGHIDDFRHTIGVARISGTSYTVPSVSVLSRYS